MENSSIELCPICMEKSEEYFTECNHSFCIGCLCKIKKCAMCRKPLLREKLCKEIKQNVRLINNVSNYTNFEELDNRVNAIISRNYNSRYRIQSSYELHNQRPVSQLIDSAHYNNNEEEYDEYGRRINPPDEYEPIISYYGQFPSDPIQAPSRIPRWGEDDMWQQTRDIYPLYPQNRIPRWGDPRH